MNSHNPWVDLAILSVSGLFGLWLFYGDNPFISNDMNFFIINNIEDSTTEGVILESEEGLLGARLSGERGTDDAALVLPKLLKRMPATGFPLQTGSISNRLVTRVRPGETDFARVYLKQLRPPLAVGASGTVPQARIDRAKTPEKITEDLWKLFEGSPEMMPKYKALTPNG